MAINAYSWAKDGEKNLSPSFKVREFRCSDNTDPIFIDSELVEILQKIRNHFGKPVNITSGFRTPAKMPQSRMLRSSLSIFTARLLTFGFLV